MGHRFGVVLSLKLLSNFILKIVAAIVSEVVFEAEPWNPVCTVVEGLCP